MSIQPFIRLSKHRIVQVFSNPLEKPIDDGLIRKNTKTKMVFRRFCLLYKLIQGQVFKSLVAQKRQDPPHLEYRTSADSSPTQMVDGPPTPCPAKVEYATPVFARNYQGIWRYVVQIPYEGYFTQTIEVTKCM